MMPVELMQTTMDQCRGTHRNMTGSLELNRSWSKICVELMVSFSSTTQSRNKNKNNSEYSSNTKIDKRKSFFNVQPTMTVIYGQYRD